MKLLHMYDSFYYYNSLVFYDVIARGIIHCEHMNLLYSIDSLHTFSFVVFLTHTKLIILF